MKLVVQIPCYNEETTLPLVLGSIPKQIKGIDTIETLIIDDGSTDDTVKVAKKLGVTHIVRHRGNKGLATSFADGIHRALKEGADIIVNTDGDNQYPQADIGRLIAPILAGTHDIVVGNRQTSSIPHFSPLKKALQQIGSRVVQTAAGVEVADAPSGFRAYSRQAAIRLNIITNFSYAMETIVQAGKKRIAITHVDIKTNPKTRESRLFTNIFQHIRRSASAIIRSYTMYEAFRIFLAGGIVIFLVGTIPYFRFGYLMIVRGETISGHLQSLIFGAVFIILGFLVIFLGIVADLLSINRKLLEDSLTRLKRIEYGDNGSVK